MPDAHVDNESRYIHTRRVLRPVPFGDCVIAGISDKTTCSRTWVCKLF